MLDVDQVLEWRGLEVHGSDGQKIGKLEEIYLDEETDRPEWAAVKTGLLGTRLHFVPLTDASRDGDTVRVPFSKAQVSDAPNAEADGELSQDEEALLYRHYGLQYGESRSDTGLAEGDMPERGRADMDTSRADSSRSFGGAPARGEDLSGPETDNAMTRSEEELRVGKAQRETGRVRLRKYIVTEHETRTVPVQREEVRIEREPITEANIGAATSGADLTEEEHEITLHAEEPVVEKRVVPKERVRLDTDTVTEEERVSEDIRKEQIDTDATGGERPIA